MAGTKTLAKTSYFWGVIDLKDVSNTFFENTISDTILWIHEIQFEKYFYDFLDLGGSSSKKVFHTSQT